MVLVARRTALTAEPVGGLVPTLFCPYYHRSTMSSQLRHTGSHKPPRPVELDLTQFDTPRTPPPTEPPAVAGRAADEVTARRRMWQPAVVCTDAAAVASAFALGDLLRQPFGYSEGPPVAASLDRELPFVVLFILAMAVYGLYQRDRRRLRASSFLDIGPRGHAIALGAIATLAVSAFTHRIVGWSKIGWVEVVFMSIPATVTLPIGRALAALAVSRNGMYRSRVVIVGSGSVASSLAQRLSRCGDVELIGFVDDSPMLPRGTSVLGRRLGGIEDLPSVCAQRKIDRVLVAFSQSSPAWVVEMLRQLPTTVRISVVPRMFELVTWQSQIEEIHGLTVMDVAPPRLGPISRATKRAMDLSVSAGALLVLSPLLVAIAVAIKSTTSGPVFFRQDRTGYKGRTFRIVKFRTMEVGADEVKIDLRTKANDVDGPLFKLHDDPRVTRVGKFLRSTSLDELPQMFNVLLGHMSLIGPRPFVPDESAGIDGWAARRYEVRPGMTGLWQISGRNDLPFEELRQLDYAYVASWSLWWDLKILWHTPASVLRRQGAY